jgi:hypothetical protein
LIQRTQPLPAAAHGIPVALVPSPADDFNEMVSHHYIESFDNHRKGIVNDCLEVNDLNVYKPHDCLPSLAVLQGIFGWRSRAWAASP